jgi:hypothetical protein
VTLVKIIGFGFVAPLCLAGVVSAGMVSVASAQDNREPDALRGRQCSVNVTRTDQNNAFSVAKRDLENGSCVCDVTAAPLNQNTGVENNIRALVQNRECAAVDPAGVIRGGGTALIGGTAAAGVAAVVIGASRGGTDNPLSP